MWESMSSPFFIEPCLYRQGSFFLMDRRVRPKGLGSSLSFKNPVSNQTGFFVLILIGVMCFIFGWGSRFFNCKYSIKIT
jgi:hypothetical protein